MKRIVAIAIAAILIAFFTIPLASCTQPKNEKAGKMHIICTVFPQYDWVRQILGDAAQYYELTMLLNSRADLHNYQPSVDDIVKITSCDMFVYVGGESDGWVSDVLGKSTNPDMVVINLLETLGDAAKLEELLEGMEAEEESEEEGEADDEDEAEYDEHVWLSLRNAKIFCEAIASELSNLDKGNAAVFQGNLASYLEKLSALDEGYRAAVDSAPARVLLFGDRFPFRYMMDDYGLTCFAAFAGCSAETEASFDTIIFLAKKTDELNLNSIVVTESSDQSIANTIINNSSRKDQQIIVLDAMQSVSAGDVDGGATYLSIMERNLVALKEALR